MKILIAFLTMIACNLPFSVGAQIQIGSSQFSKNPGKIRKEEFAAFKKSTTVFILQEKNYKNKEAFEKAIAKVWTVTPFKIITPEEIKDHNPSNTSFFSFGGFLVARQSQNMIVYSTYLSYDLYMIEKSKKGKYDQNLFAKFLLHPDFETYEQTMRMAARKQSEFSDIISSFLYSKATIYNWSPAMLMGYLKTINDGLQNENTRGLFEEDEDKQALSTLATDTLYIPDYVNTKFNKFTGAETEIEKGDDDIKDAYPLPVKFVTNDQLNQLIYNSPNGIKYLSYIKSSNDKFVSVFDSKTGKLIYSRHTSLSYNFKNKDLKKIATAAR